MLTSEYSDSVIRTEHLCRTYGKHANAFDALKDVTIDIKKGESIAIIGKSGSGKSTLMHLLALLDKPTSGDIYIAGESVKRLRHRDKNRLRNQQFGFVFQSFFMNAHDTVLQNVLLPLKIAKVPARKRREMAIAALEAVELGDKLKSKAKDLSGGQKQRVCIARALVNNPQIIFADEPTGNLDSTTGALVEEILFKLNRDKGITLIIVTHDPDLAAKCDRQITIRDGQVVHAESEGQA